MDREIAQERAPEERDDEHDDEQPVDDVLPELARRYAPTEYELLRGPAVIEARSMGELFARALSTPRDDPKAIDDWRVAATGTGSFGMPLPSADEADLVAELLSRVAVTLAAPSAARWGALGAGLETMRKPTSMEPRARVLAAIRDCRTAAQNHEADAIPRLHGALWEQAEAFGELDPVVLEIVLLHLDQRRDECAIAADLSLEAHAFGDGGEREGDGTHSKSDVRARTTQIYRTARNAMRKKTLDSAEACNDRDAALALRERIRAFVFKPAEAHATWRALSARCGGLNMNLHGWIGADDEADENGDDGEPSGQIDAAP